jgi:hypothetical protein
MPKSTAKQRKQIGVWINGWQRTLFLNDWDIKTYYHDADKSSGAAASTNCSTRYYEASIDFYPGLFSEDDETQWKVVAHEMLHIVVSALQCKAQRPHDGISVSPAELEDAVEQTVTRLTNIVASAWPYKK